MASYYSRSWTRVYKYAVFYFPNGKSVGSAKTSLVCEGFKNKIREEEWVHVEWEGQPVSGKIKQSERFYFISKNLVMNLVEHIRTVIAS